MVANALFLFHLACTVYAGRVKTSSGRREHGANAGHQYSQTRGNTNFSSPSLLELRESESNARAVATKPSELVALLLLAFGDPAQAFAGHRLAAVTGQRLPDHHTSNSLNMIGTIDPPKIKTAAGQSDIVPSGSGVFSSPSYIHNALEAVDSLNRDIPQALRFESYPQRVAPTNWGVYTDDFVTEVKVGDPMALRLLEALVPSFKMVVKGKRSHQRFLEELRTCFRTISASKLVENEKVTVQTHKHVDPSTQQEVIQTRWITRLPMKRLQPPVWLPRPPFVPAPARKPDKRIVTIEALSNFHLNAEGKIYRQSIDGLNLLVDGKPIDSTKLAKFLDLIALLPLPRLPLPPDNFRK